MSSAGVSSAPSTSQLGHVHQAQGRSPGSVLGRAPPVPCLCAPAAPRPEKVAPPHVPNTPIRTIAKDTQRVQCGQQRISYEQRVCETSVKPTPKMPLQKYANIFRKIGGHLWNMFKPKFNRYCCKSRQIGVRNHTDAHSHSHMKASHVNLVCVYRIQFSWN